MNAESHLRRTLLGISNDCEAYLNGEMEYDVNELLRAFQVACDEALYRARTEKKRAKKRRR